MDRQIRMAMRDGIGKMRHGHVLERSGLEDGDLVRYATLSKSRLERRLPLARRTGGLDLAYKAENMVPAASNAQLARATFDIALFNLPACLKLYGYSVASCLLVPRLQAPME
jgi:hypothetical protein